MPSPDEWGALLDGLELPSYPWVVDEALSAGVVTEDPEAGTFGTLACRSGETAQGGDESVVPPHDGIVPAQAADGIGAREAFVDAIEFFHGQRDA